MRIADSPILACIALLATSSALADQTPRTGVIDQAGVVAPDVVASLNGWLLELEKKTGAQLKVWTIESTNGRDVHELAMETAKLWRLGQKGKDNGCLVAIAVKDKKWSVATGEGIEGALPDLYCDKIAEKYFVPYFRKGDFSQGILQGTIALAQSIAQEHGVELAGVPKVRLPRRPGSGDVAVKIIFGALTVIFALIVIGSSAGRRGRYNRGWGGGALQWIILGQVLNSLGRSGRSNWSGGSSWGGFGGGGGGFGGGGGGSFGGGGASGGW